MRSDSLCDSIRIIDTRQLLGNEHSRGAVLGCVLVYLLLYSTCNISFFRNIGVSPRTTDSWVRVSNGGG